MVPGEWVKCNICGDIIRSEHRHDFKRCSCKRIAVDGGSDYLKMVFTERTDFTILGNKLPEERTEYTSLKRLT